MGAQSPMSPLSAPTPPLLLTKRLTAFLHSNLSPQIHTSLLATLSGKLLAHASSAQSQSATTLRTQCTVAASLWAIYSAPTTRAAIPESLPSQSQSQSKGEEEREEEEEEEESELEHPKPTALTIQLTGAVMVLRLLRCGLLFVCFGPPAEGPASGPGLGDHSAHQHQHQQRARTPQPPSETNSNPNAIPTPTIGSPSEVESVRSAGAATITSVTTTGSAGVVGAAGVVAVRRQAEDLARWLDDKLGSLGIPDDEGSAFESR